LDKLTGAEDWKSTPASDDYDYQLIKHRLEILREIKESGDANSILFHIRAGVLRNFGGITNPKLFQRTFVGTKHLIEEYVREVINQLEYVYKLDESVLPLQKKCDFFSAAYQTFGRSALVLHGTVAFGIYQLGIVKALFEKLLLPKVICGTSAGALVAAVVCCKNDDELPQIFENGGINFNAFQKRPEKGRTRRRLKRLFEHGVLMDVRILEQALFDNIGNMTFEEAYIKTGRILNITLTMAGKYNAPRLLNYLNAPNVVVWSAACASCSVSGLYENVDLMAKSSGGEISKWNPEDITWTPASGSSELQMSRLSELFFVNHFIVSRVLPYSTPWSSTNDKEEGFIWTLHKLVKSEIEHRFKQLEEFNLLPSIFSALYAMQRGDINIVPRLSVNDYFWMFNLPTNDMVQHCIKQGERATWPLMSLIKIRLGIEKQLEILNDRLKLEKEAVILQYQLNEEEEEKRRVSQNRVERSTSNHF